ERFRGDMPGGCRGPPGELSARGLQAKPRHHAQHTDVRPEPTTRGFMARRVELLDNRTRGQADHRRQRFAQSGIAFRCSSRIFGTQHLAVGAKLYPARLGGRESTAGALADHAPLLLGHGGVDVQWPAYLPLFMRTLYDNSPPRDAGALLASWPGPPTRPWSVKSVFGTVPLATTASRGWRA